MVKYLHDRTLYSSEWNQSYPDTLKQFDWNEGGSQDNYFYFPNYPANFTFTFSHCRYSGIPPLSFLSQIPPIHFHHDLILSYKNTVLSVCRRGGVLHGEVIHPLLLDTSLIRCSDSMNEQTPIWVGWLSANDNCHLLILYLIPGTEVEFFIHSLLISTVTL